MEKIIYIIILLELFHLSLNAQKKPQKYYFSSQIEKGNKFKHDNQKAREYSYIGEYRKALLTYELNQEIRQNAGEKENLIGENELMYFESFQPVNAIDFILEKSASERIIIINEAHHKPIHRVFIELLLEGLHKRGFNYLGLEALTPNFEDAHAFSNDTLLNKRGYPLNSQSTGIYTREPQFANMIREAVNIGIHVFGYESTPFQHGISRDSAQAINIARILKKDPNAKIILLCGYAHLVETTSKDLSKNYGQARWLAGYLKELLDINPLTINQELLTERLIFPNSPYYNLINEDNSSVFIDENGLSFNGPKEFDKYDILVHHSKTIYKYKRPHWLFREGKYLPYSIRKEDINISCPCLIKAYYEKENNLAVPVDIIEIDKDFNKNTLVLPSGYFKIKIENELGKKQTFSILVE